jgi:hypothetical protein
MLPRLYVIFTELYSKHCSAEASVDIWLSQFYRCPPNVNEYR